MLRKVFPRLVKYGLGGGVVIGSTAYALNYDYDSSVILRISRTAATAIDIGKTYNDMLYSKQWDKDSKEYSAIKSEAHRICAEKLLELCKANKGAYIKVGQHVGALEYLVPSEYVTTMQILHRDAPENTVEELFKVIQEDLNKDPKTIFTEFDEKPLGTASLAQVHKAKLEDGTVVAVKVQHYFVKKNIEIDLIWMEIVLRLMMKVFPDFELAWLIDETKRNITKELDFLQEGKNAEKVAVMFQNYKWLKIPKIYWDYCTSRVLVMDYVEGGYVNDLKYINSHNIDRADLCRKLGDLYSHMIFISGFVHSDPHPGNIMLKKDPSDKDVTIYLLDHGLYANLTDKFRYHYSKLWLSIISRDREQMRIHSEALGIDSKLYGLFACIVTGRPWESIMKGIEKTSPTSEEKNVFQKELPNIAHYITQCLERVDRQALLVLKTNDLIRSIEYAVGMQDRMCGFMVMTQCCLESVYQLDYKEANSTLRRQYLNVKFAWTMLTLYLYSVFLALRDKFKRPGVRVDEANSTLRRQYLNVKFAWTMLTLYLYSVFLALRDKFKRPGVRVDVHSTLKQSFA